MKIRGIKKLVSLGVGKYLDSIDIKHRILTSKKLVILETNR